MTFSTVSAQHSYFVTPRHKILATSQVLEASHSLSLECPVITWSAAEMVEINGTHKKITWALVVIIHIGNTLTGIRSFKEIR